MYRPKPIDTSGVLLPDDLFELTERIAENVHDTWAQQRIREGWRYGPFQNSVKKETPWLVPYADLPESEKEYDRNTAINTLKLVVMSGYKIVR